MGTTPAPHAEIHRVARDRLAEHDQRYTTGRRQIVHTLADADRPVTLPELLSLAPALPQSSAYRNLSVLADAGVVRRLVHGAEHAHFELAEGLTEHHHHLICESCGVIRDVTLDNDLEASLETAFDGLARDAGFEPTHHAIDVYGRCRKCAGGVVAGVTGGA